MKSPRIKCLSSSTHRIFQAEDVTLSGDVKTFAGGASSVSFIADGQDLEVNAPAPSGTPGTGQY